MSSGISFGPGGGITFGAGGRITFGRDAAQAPATRARSSAPPADLVFLFGAGASFGDRHVTPRRPPLGGQLFSELCRFDAVGWGALPDGYRQVFDQDFEAGMNLLWNSAASVAVAPLMQRMAIFFLRYRWAYPVNDPPFTVRLIRALKDTGLLGATVLSSLNYECLLELAVTHAGGIVEYQAGPTGQGQSAAVCKLHGSANFDVSSMQASGVQFGRGVVFDGPVAAWTDLDAAVEHWRSGTALAPVMALYQPGKTTQSGSSQLGVWWADWAVSVAGARAVFVIGVRPNVEDEHVWRPLADAPGRLLVIGDIGDIAETRQWAAVHRSGRSTTVLAPTLDIGLQAVLRELRRRD